MENTLDPIFIYKKQIDRILTTFLEDKVQPLSHVNQWAEDSLKRLIPFVTGGKSVRGCLLAYTASLYGKQADDAILAAAAALELIHSGLLIHDDITDKDALRRNNPSMHTQYTYLFDKHPDESQHLGESMAIHVGDMCYMMAFELISRAGIQNDAAARIMTELQYVLVAQMQDAAAGFSHSPITKDDILSTYRYKTARYTFSLPCMIGALLAGEHDTSDLEALGEDIGLLYQIRDDELNAAGDSGKTGKSTGSDMRNQKRTLQSTLPPARYTEISTATEASARARIQSLRISPAGKQTLSALLDFCIQRDR